MMMKMPGLSSLAKCQWIPWVACAVALAACDPGGASGERMDAPVGADAGRDAELEPGRDASRDGRPQDPPRDAAPDPAVDGAAVDGAVDGAPDASLDQGLPVEDPCGFGPTGSPDDDRVVLIGHPFGEEEGGRGHDIRSMVLRADGTLVDVGARLDLGSRAERIAFTPSGRFAIVVGEDGVITLVEVVAPDDLQIRDVAAVDPQGTADLVMHPDGHTAWLLRADVNEANSGIFTLTLGCDGTLNVAPEHFGLRLTEAMALYPGDPDQALLLGGQAVFTPIDDFDIRLLTRAGDGWSEVGRFDIFHDFVQASGIAVSPDKRTAAIPNASPFSDEGHQLVILDLSPDGVVERHRIQNLEDAVMTRFSPDGETLMLLRPEPGRITLLTADAGGRFGVVDELVPGLTTDFAVVSRGEGRGLLVVPSVHPADGSRVQVYRLEGPGQARLIDAVELPEGFEQIPGAIGTRP
jgi:hypothetical protein